MNTINQSVRPGFVSKNYAFIPTAPLLTAAQDQGWKLVETKIQAARTPERQGFEKHRLILEHETLGHDEDSKLRLYVLNSHDRTSAFQFNLGFFRFICENGLMIGDAIGTQFKVYHTGRKTEEGVLTQFREALNAVPKALELRARMRETQLNQFEQIRIEQALRDVVQYERGLIIDAGEMIRPVRREEYGVTDLWTLFNTAQERAIQGRFLGTRVNTLTGEMRRISKAKSIKSIVADASLNKKLFDVAVQFIKH